MSFEEAVRASVRVHSVTFMKPDGAEFKVRLLSYDEENARFRARGVLADCARWATTDADKVAYAEWENWPIIRIEKV